MKLVTKCLQYRDRLEGTFEMAVQCQNCVLKHSESFGTESEQAFFLVFFKNEKTMKY